MCWLRLNRTHRNMVQGLLAPPAGVVLEVQDVARLVYAARAVGRMPEQLMQVCRQGWSAVPPPAVL